MPPSPAGPRLGAELTAETVACSPADEVAVGVSALTPAPPLPAVPASPLRPPFPAGTPEIAGRVADDTQKGGGAQTQRDPES